MHKLITSILRHIPITQLLLFIAFDYRSQISKTVIKKQNGESILLLKFGVYNYKGQQTSDRDEKKSDTYKVSILLPRGHC